MACLHVSNMSPISTHALREEGDPFRSAFIRSRFIFLSTPSARRATWATLTVFNRSIFLSTPSARRATCGTLYSVFSAQFLPTPSVRRATDAVGPADRGLIISTHALREEGDPYSASSSVRAIFLPTPSARRATFLYPGLKLQSRRFLPTPSARRATW